MTNNTQNKNVSIKSRQPIPDIKTKKEFIVELSNRAGFTQKDTEIFLESFISIFEDATLYLSEIDIQGFLSLRHTRIEQHSGSRPTKGKVGEYEKVWIPDSTRTTLSLSKSIKNFSKVDLDKLDDEE